MCRLVLPISLNLIALGCLRADVIISEFLADHLSGIKDENDTHQDWIELYNSGSAPVSLDGWWITDNSAQTAKWKFPNISIPAGGILLVWASGKDRRIVGQPLHTNFSLSKAGEYLGLYQPAVGTDPRLADLPVLEFTWSMDKTTRHPALRFRRPAGALDVTYELLSGENLSDWPAVSNLPVESSPLPGNIEEVIFRDTTDDSNPSRFLRLRYVVCPQI